MIFKNLQIYLKVKMEIFSPEIYCGKKAQDVKQIPSNGLG